MTPASHYGKERAGNPGSNPGGRTNESLLGAVEFDERESVSANEAAAHFLAENHRWQSLSGRTGHFLRVFAPSILVSSLG